MLDDPHPPQGVHGATAFSAASEKLGFMQTERTKPGPGAPTYAHEPEQASGPRSKPTPMAAADAKAIVESTFFTVLITPKLTFSLPRRSQWRTADDIPQAALQEAFLSRFPVRIDAEQLIFKCATPAVSLAGTERLVYRIGSSGGGVLDHQLRRTFTPDPTLTLTLTPIPTLTHAHSPRRR